MNFADRLQGSIERSRSIVVAGFDPRIESFPSVFVEKAGLQNSTNEDAIYRCLASFYHTAIEVIAPHVSAVKPNVAFFEHYGIAGMRAFKAVCEEAHNHGLQVIADGKRGDISSTAAAYSSAYLGAPQIFGKNVSAFSVDALTVNPFLGFDSLEPFLEDCIKFEKGLFILVRTSNSGSADLQQLPLASGVTISEHLAQWIGTNAERLRGTCGYSSLGAVIGATFPAEAEKLRRLMPNSFMLVPGMGAQGASAKEAIAARSAQGGGIIVNLSRGLFSFEGASKTTEEETRQRILERVKAASDSLNEALGSK